MQYVTKAKYDIKGNPPLAVDSNHIAYVVGKPGCARVLARGTARRCALQGFHQDRVTDAKFDPAGTGILAIASADGLVSIQRIDDSDEVRPEEA